MPRTATASPRVGLDLADCDVVGARDVVVVGGGATVVVTVSVAVAEGEVDVVLLVLVVVVWLCELVVEDEEVGVVVVVVVATGAAGNTTSRPTPVSGALSHLVFVVTGGPGVVLAGCGSDEHGVASGYATTGGWAGGVGLQSCGEL